ncbi:hypothetical protein R4B61_05405 [Fructilactobacillus vespulae]|uniref:hypothetical protein n=1 Tax=Fructilactobacillus vespulae TaxID=1249630 RepID=UPI0039B6CADC
MMNFNELNDMTVNLYRQFEAKKQMVWKDNHHLLSIVTSLDIHLGELAVSSRLDDTKINSAVKLDSERQIDAAIGVLKDFFLMASICNWTDIFELSEKEQKRLQILPVDDKAKLDTLYLSIKNMILKSFYEKDKTSFRHGWILFYKWIFSDLKFDETGFEKDFQEKVKKEQENL